MNSFVIRNQWPRTRSLNSMLISLKALVVFKVNFLLQLILQLLQSGIHHAVLWKLSMKFWGRNLILLSHKECKDKLPSQLTWLTPLFVSLRTMDRLDLDHKDLYKAIRRPCYFTPHPGRYLPWTKRCKLFLNPRCLKRLLEHKAEMRFAVYLL